YRTAKELAEDLKKFQAGQLVGVYPYSTAERIRRWIRQNRRAAGGAGAASIALALVVTASLLSIDAKRRDGVAQQAIAEERRRDAEAAKEKVEQGLVALLTEQGRQELLAGHPLRAAPYLSEAYQRAGKVGGADPSLRFLVAQAMQPIDALQFS